MMTEAVPVRSTNLSSIAYDADAKILRVNFQNGGVYDYAGVPQLERDQLIAASSPGAYFHARIRNVYPASKVS